MLMMRQSLVPVLLLATVALSSSNVLPLLSSISRLQPQPFSFGDQQNDNIFSDKIHTLRVLKNIFCKDSSETRHILQSKLCKYIQINIKDRDNKRFEENLDQVTNKEENYNGKGFRKKQWHNYPRQLDRLHKYLYAHHTISEAHHSDPYDLQNAVNGNDDDTLESPNRYIQDSSTNEFLRETTEGDPNIYDTISAETYPLVLLKICLNNDLDSDSLKYTNLILPQRYREVSPISGRPKGEEILLSNDLNPLGSEMMTESKDTVRFEDVFPDNSAIPNKKTVKKRIFSFWTRLQNLSHKGHELHHRRHLHAFYGLPDADGSGDGKTALTAETRAALMRPPGSPLRWG